MIHSAKAHRRRERLNFRIRAVEIRARYQSFFPGFGFGVELHERKERFERLSLREVFILRVTGELAEQRFLRSERFAGNFVGAVGGEPEFAAQREIIRIERSKVDDANARAVVAVLLVIAYADDDANGTRVNVLIGAKSAEDGFGVILLDVGKAVFDVIRRGHVVHFQVLARTIEFFAHRLQEWIGKNGGGRFRWRRGFRGGCSCCCRRNCGSRRGLFLCVCREGTGGE